MTMPKNPLEKFRTYKLVGYSIPNDFIKKYNEIEKKLKAALQEVDNLKNEIKEKEKDLKQVDKLKSQIKEKEQQVENLNNQIKEKEKDLKQVDKLKKIIREKVKKQCKLEIDLDQMKKANFFDEVNKLKDGQDFYKNQITQYKKEKIILVSLWVASLFFSHVIANIKSIEKCIKRKIKRKQATS